MSKLFDVLFAVPTLAAFEGNDDDNDGGDDGNGLDAVLARASAEAEAARKEADRKAAEAREAAEAAQAARELAFSQDDLNRFLAEDRRKHVEKYRKLEASYKELLEDKNLAAERRTKLETELEDLQKSFRTKEQQAEFERKREREAHEKTLIDLKDRSTRWEKMYKDSVVQRSLQDAAVAADAFNPNQIISILRPWTQMRPKTDDAGNDELVPVINFPDIDEKTGEQIETLRTPNEAVQRMKELPEVYGNLFRANVVSGIGSGSATGGVSSGDGGRIDPTKLSSEQYRRLRKENPEALGLRRRPKQ